MRAIAVIPARGGSKRLPGKNIRAFHGRPIIEYSICAAFYSGVFDHVVVSTDSETIRDIARGLGANVDHRPSHLAGDDATVIEVLSAFCADPRASGLDLVACVYATAPLIQPSDLWQGWAKMRVQPDLDYCLAVDPDGRDAGQWCFGRREAWALQKLRPLGRRTYRYELPAERAVDINTAADWRRAAALFEKRGDHGNAE